MQQQWDQPTNKQTNEWTVCLSAGPIVQLSVAEREEEGNGSKSPATNFILNLSNRELD